MAALALALCVTGIACNEAARSWPGESPIAGIHVDGGEAFVELEHGLAVRDLIGSRIFDPLRPGMTPEEASRTIGPPVGTEVAEYMSLFYYEGHAGKVAIGERRIAGSGTSQRTTAHDVRAFSVSEFTEHLPTSLRKLLREEPGLKRVVVFSDVPEDWRVSLSIRQRQVEYIVAFPAQ
jgi:hypothetical protein